VTRCPSCGARAAADAAWCTLCYAKLAEPVAAVPAMSIAAPLPAAPVSVLTEPPLQVASSAPSTLGWPCHRCGTVVSLELSSCSACGGPFLAPTNSTAANPRSPSLARLTRSGPLKLLVMVGGALVISVVLAGLFWAASVFV
jgi:hypothetical protein